MSSLHGTIHRYQLIIDKLGRKTYPTLQEMKDYLHDQGFENSLRTVQRDIEAIRNEFGVEITYHRTRKGYYINDESQVNLEQFLRLANLAQMTQFIAKPVMKDKDLFDYISFESKGSLRGLHFIAPLFNATKKKLKVKIHHTTFYRNETRIHEVWPYLLKEYNERWYVVAWAPEKNEFRSYGVDRINELEVTDEPFDRSSHPDPSEFFKDAIGIIHSNQNAELVELSFEPFLGKYIKTLPLHDSQVIVEDNDQELRIKLWVHPNIELQRKILSYGSKVKVIQPKKLVTEIALELKKNIARYN